MDQCGIRPATERDAKQINDVSQYLGYVPLSDSDSLEKLSELIHSDSDKVYVAEISGKIVGWLHLFYARRLASDNFFEIGGLVVHPEFRHQSIGKRLVQKATEEHQGTLRVRCNETRSEAHKFYEQIGFIAKKTQRVFENLP